MAVIGKDGKFDPSESSREKTDAELGHHSSNAVVGTKVVDNTKTMTEDSDDPAASRLDNVAHNKGSFLSNLFHKNNESAAAEQEAKASGPLPGKSKQDGALGEGNVPPEEDDNNEGSKALEGVSKFVAKKVLHIFLTMGLPGFLLFFLILIFVIIAMVNENIAAIFNFGSDHYDPAIADNPALTSYKDALFEAIDNYESQSGCDIDEDYVHFTLYYPYFSGSDEDFEYMEDNILDVLDLFVEHTSCPTSQIDYEINGSLFDRLQYSTFLRDYFIQAKGNSDEIDMKQAITDIFEAADSSNSMREENEKDNGDVLFSKSLVTIRETGKEYDIQSYFANAVYAKMAGLNLPINENNFELMKAYTVIATSEFISNTAFMGNETKFEIDSGRIKTCNIETGCYKAITPQNSIYYIDGADGSGNYTFEPLTVNQKTLIKNAVSSAFGYVLEYKNDHSYYYPDSKTLKNVGNFSSIIYDSYPSARFVITRIAESGYSGYVTFGIKDKKKINTIFYKQTDYNNTFCGKSGSTIKSSGCGVTSMAIVVSTYKNDRKYDPVFMMNKAYSGFAKKYCGPGISGTSRSFFKVMGNSLGYTTRVVYPNSDGLEKLMESLFNNTLAIVRVGAGHYTTGGHYMVISGVDTTGGEPLVYVDDPYTDINSSKPGRKGSGWVSLNNIIAKEAKEFYIISR